MKPEEISKLKRDVLEFEEGEKDVPLGKGFTPSDFRDIEGKMYASQEILRVLKLIRGKGYKINIVRVESNGEAIKILVGDSKDFDVTKLILKKLNFLGYIEMFGGGTLYLRYTELQDT